MAHAADAGGVLEIVAQVGDTIAVGEVIARLGDRAKTAAKSQLPPAADPAAAARAEPMVFAGGNGRAVGDGKAKATPLAQRLACEHGIDLQILSGTGPRGRVTKNDVLRAADLDPKPPVPPSPGAPTLTQGPIAAPLPAVRIQQPTRLQQVVAGRMAQAGATVPHFQVQTEAVFDAALQLRSQLKLAASDSDPIPSLNDLIVKACALALPHHPFVNGSFKDGAYELHDNVHVGVAVAIDDGLVVATVSDADQKSLGHIARDTKRLTERVRAGSATPNELNGATFTVSNLGMYGMTAITAMINPPQAAILGVGAVRPTLARADDGEIIDRQLLTLTLSCDHRILNGADGARFLHHVKEILENPLRLAL
jgi:pyruvate dehydrogenase E2 component (dihydrolipoamide acetyltransferase)